MAEGWNSWIDRLMAPDGSGVVFVKDAAICGSTAGQESVWCSSPGLCSVLAAEIRKFVTERKEMCIAGAYICGQKCRMLCDQMDDDQVYSCDLKTATDAEGNTFNVCVGKSKQALVIAIGHKDVGGGS